MISDNIAYLLFYTINTSKVMVCLLFLCVYKHVMSYQDGYEHVTVLTHGNLIVLPFSETRLPVP